MIDLLLPYIVPGIIYGIGAIGIAIILRYLQAPDFTCLGAIMVGGIIAVIATNAIGPWCGILLGTLAGGMLGGITALLRCVLKIPLVLSGIITYTASISFGYLLTNRGGTGGTIALSKPTGSLFHPTFQLGDAFYLSSLAVTICVFGGLAMKTKFGSLVLAMKGDPQFIENRHKYYSLTAAGLLFTSNALIGLAGALYSMKEVSAGVSGHFDFFPYALGAIFGGEAVTRFISEKFKSEKKYNLIERVASEPRAQGATHIVTGMGNLFSDQKDDSSTIGFHFFTYVLGCLLMSVIAGLAVEAGAGRIFTRFSFPPDLEHLVTAVLITIFVCFAGSKKGKV
jgi:ABC-type uncharacterized transport system permease subunit